MRVSLDPAKISAVTFRADNLPEFAAFWAALPLWLKRIKAVQDAKDAHKAKLQQNKGGR